MLKDFETATGADEGYVQAELARYEMLTYDPDLSSLQNALIETLGGLGFERFVASVLWPAQGVKRSTYVTNYSPDWMRRRLRNNYRSHDIVASRAMQTGQPFYWADLERRHLTRAQARVMEEARTFGLRTGATLTRIDDMAGRLCLSVSTVTDQNEFAKLFMARKPQLDTLMKTISTQFRTFQNRDAARSAAPVLTPHECETLMYAARGLTTHRTAVAMGISDYTVKDHVKAAMAKLAAKNKTEAVAKAMVAGYILP